MNRRLRKVFWAALGVITLLLSVWLLWPPAPAAPSEAETWHSLEDVQQGLAARGLPLHVLPHSLPDEGILTISAERARERFSDTRGIVSIRRFPSPGEAAEWESMRPTNHLRIGPWYLEGDPKMLAAIASRLSGAGD
jgi:hypothetical protein